MIRAPHKQPGFLAALLHRLSGLVLAIFLPLHFLALATALNGADALDSFLSLTENLLVKSTEAVLIVALATHLAFGLRVLAIELFGFRERTPTMVSLCIGFALAFGLAFVLNVA